MEKLCSYRPNCCRTKSTLLTNAILNHRHTRSYKASARLSSLVPRPSLAAFFAAMEKHTFFHGCKKSCEGRPGYEARDFLHMHLLSLPLSSPSLLKVSSPAPTLLTQSAQALQHPSCTALEFGLASNLHVQDNDVPDIRKGRLIYRRKNMCIPGFYLGSGMTAMWVSI